MSARASCRINGATLMLLGELDYDSVLEVSAQGSQWLHEVGVHVCQLDLSNVTYSNSAGVALLLGWLRIAQQQQKLLRIVNMPAGMSALATMGGLENLLVQS